MRLGCFFLQSKSSQVLYHKRMHDVVKLGLSKLPENCPVCGAEMEKGYLVAGGGASVFWRKDKLKHLWNIRDNSVIILGNSVVNWSIPQGEGYRCTNCKLVLFSYEKEIVQNVVPEKASPPKPLTQEEKDEYLYTRLLGSSYGTLHKDILDRDIDALMANGLGRIDATKQLAKEKEII